MVASPRYPFRFNANVTKAVERYAANELSGATEVSLRIIGRKGNQYFARRRATVTSFDGAPTGATALDLARETANRVIDDFASGKVDRVFVVYNEFKSAISQEVRFERLLPLPDAGVLSPPSTLSTSDPASGATEFLYEPDPQSLRDRLVPRYIEITVYRALLESQASEFGARMSAMDAATRNAKDMIGRLTLIYNRARQAAITKELMEIIGGAVALTD